MHGNTAYRYGCRCGVCRKAHRETAKRWRQLPQSREKIIQNRRGWKAQRLEYVTKLKEASPCTDCKQYFPAVCMDFDHLDGNEKVASISQLRKWRSMEELNAEIAKCELVCSNCHRLRTQARHRERAFSGKGECEGGNLSV